jgi:hypothetical protein
MGTMDRLRILTIVVAVALLAAFCASIQAQTETGEGQTETGQAQTETANAQTEVPDTSAARLRVNIVPEKLSPTPFPAGSEIPAEAAPVEVGSADQMTEKDRELAADAESSIGERAAFRGMDFNQGTWSYEELLCPALPNHIFLRYTRNNGAGDVSVLTASIPRSGDGRVRIIPIQMRGYSLFSPAPINALTISAFNHIRAEEHPDKTPDWLGTGLCYAALAGAQAQSAASKVRTSQKYQFRDAIPAMLHIQVNGGAMVEFTAGSDERLMQWTMTFDRNGRLLKATHMPAGWREINAVPNELTEVKGRPLPATIQDVDSAGKPIQ